MSKVGHDRRTWFVALVLFVAAACGPLAAGGGSNTARIVVDNQHGPVGTVQIWMVPETGVRTLIGNVGAARVDTLSFSVPAAAGEYRLRADPATGGEIISRPFRFLAGATMVRWDLGSNTVFVSEP